MRLRRAVDDEGCAGQRLERGTDAAVGINPGRTLSALRSLHNERNYDNQACPQPVSLVPNEFLMAKCAPQLKLPRIARA